MTKKKTHPSADLSPVALAKGEARAQEGLPPAKYVPYHDDPPCRTRLDACGDCPECGFHPDMQSLCLCLHCPTCDLPLSGRACPGCGRKYEVPSR